MSRKQNPHVGSRAIEHVREAMAADAETREIIEAEMARLALAAQVRALREKRGLTQTELARLVGTAQPNIARLETGRVTPTLDLLRRVAKAFGTRIDIRFVAKPA